jgi:hypothetical protein
VGDSRQWAVTRISAWTTGVGIAFPRCRCRGLSPTPPHFAAHLRWRCSTGGTTPLGLLALLCHGARSCCTLRPAFLSVY